MSRADLSSRTCTLARAVALVGDEWTLMILREMFLGNRRFDSFLHQTGISSHLLSQRLKKMETAGIIRRETYSRHPPRHEYRLTEKGRTLWPVVIAMKQWGDQWLGDGEVPVELMHKSCGDVCQAEMTCSECGEPMDAHDTEPLLSQTFENERESARKRQ